MNADTERQQKYGGGYETAILDVWYMLHHLNRNDLDFQRRNQLAMAENRLRLILEATGRFEDVGEMVVP